MLRVLDGADSSFTRLHQVVGDMTANYNPEWSVTSMQFSAAR